MTCHSDADNLPTGYWIEAIALVTLLFGSTLIGLVGAWTT